MFRSIPPAAGRSQNGDVEALDATLVLDREQLKEITMDDQELMREVLFALIQDTSQQLVLLDAAIRQQDVDRCMRLAHYSKGACANVGANRAAALLKRMEQYAARADFADCAQSLRSLTAELDLLRQESEVL